MVAPGRTQHHAGTKELFGFALQRALHVGDCAVKIEGDSQGHCLNTLTFFLFVPRDAPQPSQNGAFRVVRNLEPDRGVMSSGIWRLVGLACTLAALFLVN